MIQLLQGDALEQLARLEKNSIDALVTDPPAGISFMGKGWNDDFGGRDEWIPWLEAIMRKARWVMKPGAHGLVWAIPRTSHWTATALENAGFEIRDVVTHLFGQGFPKSHDVSKALDRGFERKKVGEKEVCNPKAMVGQRVSGDGSDHGGNIRIDITAPTSHIAKRYQGWGTALKPASEHWILIRKSLSEKTVAENIRRWGVGALNIERSLIPFASEDDLAEAQEKNPGAENGESGTYGTNRPQQRVNPKGRWPANLTTDEEAARALDAQAAGTSRFFFCAKISPAERNAGLDELPDRTLARSTGAQNADEAGEGYDKGSGFNAVQIVKNHHPTVKPKRLMRYFIDLVTPPGGTVLDCFMGSGSTGVAAKEGGFGFVGIEREPEYFQIAAKRIETIKLTVPRGTGEQV